MQTELGYFGGGTCLAVVGTATTRQKRKTKSLQQNERYSATVIPAQAGIPYLVLFVDSCLRGSDKQQNVLLILLDALIRA